MTRRSRFLWCVIAQNDDLSLTSFLDIPEVKKMFRDEFPLERITLRGDLKAPSVTKHYSLVGTAFDYLLRFYLEKKNPNCVTRPWVAEHTAILLRAANNMENNQQLIDGAYEWVASDRYLSPEEMKYYLHAALLKGTPDLAMASKDADQFLEEARNFREEYLRTGDLSDGLARSSILLAQMDVVFRAGRLPSDFGQVDASDIQDLENLISLVDPVTFADTVSFTDKNTWYLNPTFGDASTLVGGADADVILGDTLIDIKTVKTLKFTRDMYNQLIGYYILTKLGQVGSKSNFPISRLGIYFSRYGVLHTIPAEQIENNPGFPQFVRTFEKMARTVFRAKGP